MSSNDLTCSLKENLVDVLESAIFEHKTIIFVVCHDVFATTTTNLDLKISQKFIVAVAIRGVV